MVKIFVLSITMLTACITATKTVALDLTGALEESESEFESKKKKLAVERSQETAERKRFLESSGSSPAASSSGYNVENYVVKCRDARLFGSDPKLEIPLGSCSDTESACIAKFKNQLEQEVISIVYYCSKKLGNSEYKTDGVYRKIK